jgi:hypothetical protein
MDIKIIKMILHIPVNEQQISLVCVQSRARSSKGPEWQSVKSVRRWNLGRTRWRNGEWQVKTPVPKRTIPSTTPCIRNPTMTAFTTNPALQDKKNGVSQSVQTSYYIGSGTLYSPFVDSTSELTNSIWCKNSSAATFLPYGVQTDVFWKLYHLFSFDGISMYKPLIEIVRHAIMSNTCKK